MNEQKGTRAPFEAWAVVELMGHVKLAGKVTEQEVLGSKLGRIEIPQKDGTFVTQFFGGASVYRISPVSEEVARHVALSTTYMPISAWELPRLIEGPKPAEPCPDCAEIPCGCPDIADDSEEEFEGGF